ncbi:MAG: hypothetical protein ACNYNX_04330 [Leucobacter sp.]
MLVVVIGVTGSLLGTSAANAVPAQNFNPGNIISDDLFYDGYALSATEIQVFLDQRVPRCTIGDPGRTAGMPWPANNSSIASACLKNFKMTTASQAADRYCGAYSGTANESAAQIIAKVAQACGISPKVLLVMLEKEQSLVTDTWPTVRQLDVAMGANCPDSGPNWSANCDPQYYGFQKQVLRGAWLLKYYLLNPTSYQYRAGQWNTIQWNPDPTCGTSQVYIENSATAALYIYTPYRPNQAALNAGWGVGDSCSSYGNRNFYLLYGSWFGSTQYPAGTPTGEVKDLWTVSNGIRLWGWALDLDDPSAAVQIHVRFGTSWAATAADQPNSSAETLYPGSGPNHGFGLWIAAPPGPQQVCVWAKNLGNGVDRLLTCRDVVVPSGNPVGEVKELWTTPGNIRMWGWALDPDTADPIDLHVSINGRWAVVRADAQNLAVGAAYPSHGNNHGFGAAIPADPGNNRVCVYAINQGSGANTTLLCQDVFVPNGDPVGEVKEIWGIPGAIRMWGWALDLDDPSAAVQIHVRFGTSWAATAADQPNSSAETLYPGSGPNHGFGLWIAAPPGPQQVCVWAKNLGNGVDRLLTCRDVVVPSGNPVGEVKELWTTPGNIRMWGWALDPDTADPIDLHVSINGRWAVVRADAQNLAVGAAYPSHGNNHGFGAAIPADPGNNRVCVYAINQGSGANTTLLCQDVFVPNGDPVGEVKEIWGIPGAIRMWGWAADPDTADPIDLHIRVDGTQWHVIRADAPYSAMPQLLPGVGLDHGFGAWLPATPGLHEVCIWAKNVGNGNDRLLRCEIVTS